jgi:disulfide bond formation protein DsbB
LESVSDLYFWFIIVNLSGRNLVVNKGWKKRMRKKQLVIMLAMILTSAVVPLVCATSITTCTFDRENYYPGQTGFLTVTVYNDKDFKIRITDLTAGIDYYYLDGVTYEQSFFTNATLPIEVQPSESQTLFVPFSLPTNIAQGYTQLYVRSTNELWNTHSATWSGAEYPSYRPVLHIESPYKRDFQELQAANNITTMTMYLLGVTTMVFAVVALALYAISKRAHALTQPAPAQAP